MSKFVCALLCGFAVACAGRGQRGEDEPVEITAEQLDTKPHYGAAALPYGPTPYGDCLIECSQAKRVCEGDGSGSGSDDSTCRECDLAYSSCKTDCRRAFPG